MDCLAFGLAQWAQLGQSIDEEAVSLVSGDSSGRGMRLNDVTLVFKQSHVVTNSCRTNAEGVTLNERFGANRL